MDSVLTGVNRSGVIEIAIHVIIILPSPGATASNVQPVKSDKSLTYISMSNSLKIGFSESPPSGSCVTWDSRPPSKVADVGAWQP